MNTVNTYLGAAIAAAIAFLSGALALLQQQGVEHISDISPIAWIVLAIGSSISFLKDFQAITTRVALSRLTKKVEPNQ